MAEKENNAAQCVGTTRIIPSESAFHPVADIFPAMSDTEFRELVEDIREHGQREPVWILDDGRVIDGKHRVKACVELGRSVDARVYHGDEASVEAFVVSLNLKRRHLNESQRASVASRLANLKKGGDRRSEIFKGSIDLLKSQSDAAELMGVSVPSVKRAVAVQRDGTPELIAAVDAGQVSVSAAAEVATLPEDEQREVVAAGPDAMKNAAKAVRERKRPHVANNSGNMEWYTPPEIIERARLVMGVIDCDPASTAQANEIIRADCFYTIEDDGLTKPWNGCVWLNPPYGQPEIAQFAEAVVAKNAAREFDQACVLVNNATETNWFQSMLRDCTAVCFLKGRVKFIDCDGNATGAPLQGQALLYFGDDASVLQEHFGDLGVVMS